MHENINQNKKNKSKEKHFHTCTPHLSYKVKSSQWKHQCNVSNEGKWTYNHQCNIRENITVKNENYS